MRVKQKNLWLTVGIPGSGKSYFGLNKFSELTGVVNESVKIVSRDAIRFSLITESDKYFAKEEEVFSNFIEEITKALNDDAITDVIADATHLTPKSRQKVLNQISRDNVNIGFICFETDLYVCLGRNSLRTGREKVPEDVILNMKKALVYPTQNEIDKYNVTKIIVVNQEDATLLKQRKERSEYWYE